MHWKLFELILIFSVPGVILGASRFMGFFTAFLRSKYPKVNAFLWVLLWMLVLGGLVLAASFLGTRFSPDVNARFIYFQAILEDKHLLQGFLFEFLPAIFLGAVVFCVFFLVYYKVLTPKALGLSSEEKERSFVVLFEKLRMIPGLWCRIFFNGICSEIIFRWGLQSLMIVMVIGVGAKLHIGMVIGAVLGSVIYAVLHYFYWLMGIGALWNKNSANQNEQGSGISAKRFLLIMSIGYFFLSLFYGVLFMEFGIFSAMAAHVLQHALWYGLEQWQVKSGHSHLS